MNHVARRTCGGIMLASFFAFSVAMAALQRWEYREKDGSGEAAPALATIRARVEATYAQNGKLCGSSRLMTDEPFSSLRHHAYGSTETEAALEAEAAQRTGFACLGIGSGDLGDGQDMFSYESDGTHFVARAFRSYLFDPDGVLPRWEVAGEVVDGQVVTGRMRAIPAGGPTFLGHAQPRSY